MVFDGCAPLVRRWNGYVPSSKSRDAVGDVAVGELVQEVPNDIVLLLDNLKLLPDQ